MTIDILTAIQTIIDGIPSPPTWVYKETRVINWSPIGWESRIQMKVGIGGQDYPADSRAWLEHDADIIVGNRLSENSGVTYYNVLTVFPYEDHKEAELQKVTT
jgi:hypothetical protein